MTTLEVLPTESSAVTYEASVQPQDLQVPTEQQPSATAGSAESFLHLDNTAVVYEGRLVIQSITSLRSGYTRSINRLAALQQLPATKKTDKQIASLQDRIETRQGFAEESQAFSEARTAAKKAHKLRPTRQRTEQEVQEAKITTARHLLDTYRTLANQTLLTEKFTPEQLHIAERYLILSIERPDVVKAMRAYFSKMVNVVPVPLPEPTTTQEDTLVVEDDKNANDASSAAQQANKVTVYSPIVRLRDRLAGKIGNRLPYNKLGYALRSRAERVTPIEQLNPISRFAAQIKQEWQVAAASDTRRQLAGLSTEKQRISTDPTYIIDTPDDLMNMATASFITTKRLVNLSAKRQAIDSRVAMQFATTKDPSDATKLTSSSVAINREVVEACYANDPSKGIGHRAYNKLLQTLANKKHTSSLFLVGLFARDAAKQIGGVLKDFSKRS